ncbi:hypothetical protein E2C01_030685 [Portunus trituberculatus]|uniref:Uncharacterized protein n=1 Tax=Portunus trituberculatus TaxID=210409 RepID=A0A5B7ERH1_PORTR|nr:hypothetical protein [Portunus trituberculatus]
MAYFPRIGGDQHTARFAEACGTLRSSEENAWWCLATILYQQTADGRRFTTIFSVWGMGQQSLSYTGRYLSRDSASNCGKGSEAANDSLWRSSNSGRFQHIPGCSHLSTLGPGPAEATSAASSDGSGRQLASQRWVTPLPHYLHHHQNCSTL